MSAASKSIVFVVALLTAIAFYKNEQRHSERIVELKNVAKQASDAMSGLVTLHGKAAQQTTDLLYTHKTLRAELINRQNEIRRLQTDVQEIKEWADTAMPADIIRLRWRPAIIGADAYSKRLPSSDAMPTKPQ